MDSLLINQHLKIDTPI